MRKVIKLGSTEFTTESRAVFHSHGYRLDYNYIGIPKELGEFHKGDVLEVEGDYVDRQQYGRCFEVSTVLQTEANELVDFDSLNPGDKVKGFVRLGGMMVYNDGGQVVYYLEGGGLLAHSIETRTPPTIALYVEGFCESESRHGKLIYAVIVEPVLEAVTYKRVENYGK